MVGVCGRAMSENLSRLLDARNVSYQSWQRYAVKDLANEVTEYMSFRSMIDSLHQDYATDAVRLLRSYFAGFLGEVEVSESQRGLVDFLTAEGVLLRPDPRAWRYRMA